MCECCRTSRTSRVGTDDHPRAVEHAEVRQILRRHHRHTGHQRQLVRRPQARRPRLVQTLTAISIFKYDNALCIIQVHNGSDPPDRRCLFCRCGGCLLLFSLSNDAITSYGDRYMYPDLCIHNEAVICTLKVCEMAAWRAYDPQCI